MILQTNMFVCSKCGLIVPTGRDVKLGDSYQVLAPTEDWGFQQQEGYTHMVCPECMEKEEKQ
jgi:predicted RNA-binding Zn-ribbon protein involved in translation (DUF1610 family)